MRNRMTGQFKLRPGWWAALRRGTIALCLSLPSVAQAADLQVIAHREAAQIAPARPDWPRPADAGQVFYLQRSMNANTVVYAAQMTGGKLDGHTPLNAYWRRYNDAGEVKPLKLFERRLAYGVRTKATAQGYAVRFAGLPQLQAVLRLDAQGKPGLWARYDGRDIKLTSGYLELDESGMIPRVTGLRVQGLDPATGREHLVLFSVAGGEIKQ